MSSAALTDSQTSGLQLLSYSISMMLVHPETPFAGTFLVLSREVYPHILSLIIDCNFDFLQDLPHICRTEEKIKSPTSWPDCISEWNIRDP